MMHRNVPNYYYYYEFIDDVNKTRLSDSNKLTELHDILRCYSTFE